MNDLFKEFLFYDLTIIELDNLKALVIVPDNLYEFYNSIQTLSLLVSYIRNEKKLRVFSLFIAKKTFYQNIIFNDNFRLDGVIQIGKY